MLVFMGRVQTCETKHLILLALTTSLRAGSGVLTAVGGISQFQELLEVGLENVGPDGDVFKDILQDVVDALRDRKRKDVANLGNVFANGVEGGPDCGGLMDDRREDHGEHGLGRVGQDATSHSKNEIVQGLHAKNSGQEDVDGVHERVERHVIREKPHHPDGDRFVIARSFDNVQQREDVHRSEKQRIDDKVEEGGHLVTLLCFW